MRGNRNVDWRAAELLAELLGDMGWSAADLERISARTGHPARQVSKRSIYRVLSDGHKPTNPVQFEIAACFALAPSHIWGTRPLPDDWADRARVAADPRGIRGAAVAC